MHKKLSSKVHAISPLTPTRALSYIHSPTISFTPSLSNHSLTSKKGLTVEPGNKSITQELIDLKKRIARMQQQAEEEVKKRQQEEKKRQADEEKKHSAPIPFAPTPTTPTGETPAAGGKKVRSRKSKGTKKGSKKKQRELVKPYLSSCLSLSLLSLPPSSPSLSSLLPKKLINSTN
jgi:hypothetical protein